MPKTVGITQGAFSGSFVRIAEVLEAKPIMVNLVEDTERIDLLILTGGADINPAIYKQPNTHSYINQYTIRRDVFEIMVLQAARKLGKKVLGVCRGHQLINAALGGSLVQEIGLMMSHGANHEITETSGVVAKFFDRVNSMHHQGVLVHGNGLTPTSRYGGVIESTESKDIISVQWHPEAMGGSAVEFFNHIINHWE